MLSGTFMTLKLSVIKLIVIMQSDIMLSVIMLSVITLSAIMLSVVAPFLALDANSKNSIKNFGNEKHSSLIHIKITLFVS
jgi:hypothetical protein